MNRRSHALIGIFFATAVFGLFGCKKLLHAAAKDPCTLLTDAEIESALKLKVASHKGSENNCEWTLGTVGAGGQPGMVALMKSSAGAEAVLNATLGKGTPVTGVGDSAMWLGGMMPIMVVHTHGDIYRLNVMSPPLMTPDSATTKTTVIDKHQVAGGGTIEKDAVSFDYPKLESAAVVLSKTFIGRL